MALPRSEIIKPLCGLVGVTAVVWVKLFRDRFAEIAERKITPEEFSAEPAKRVVLRDVNASDNLKNLFEVPTLFTTLCLSLAATDRVTTTFYRGAWLYVALRAVHSTIHSTYNYVPHRFGVYILSSLVLWGMWGKLAWELFRS
ncbi:hypothetical protein DFJ74DRAFT_670177 [Hyaloraphidium curvatum]|nr:hypothetical protein DFJ74DRAFT_670177 [Hyaloraphidium curvatum]